MFSSNDYSKMTPDELASAEKKLKSQKIPLALFIGFMFGIAVWSATHKGGIFWTTGLIYAVVGVFTNNIRRVKLLVKTPAMAQKIRFCSISL